MNDNPYRPPDTRVEDIGLARIEPRPAAINTATAMMVASLAVGLLESVLQWRQLRRLEAPGAADWVVIVFLCTAALIGWLTYKVWEGRNWARIVLLVMFAIGMPLSVPQLPQMFSRSPVSASIFAFQTLAQFTALWIVFFTSARHWFSRTAGQ